MPFFYNARFPSKSRRDFYAILGINRNADSKTITKAYHKQSLLLHPDKNPGLENHNGFTELSQAYATLSDPEKRSEYDRIYSFDDSTRRDFDPNTTPDEATVKLQEFFELFFEKRGCSTAPSQIRVVQRESNVPPETAVKMFQNIDSFLGIEREEFPYASWHYIQLHISHKSIRDRLWDSFRELRKSFSNDPLFSRAFTLELRNGEGDGYTGLGKMDLDIHLHNLALLEQAIQQLRNENPYALLDTVIINKLAENPQDTFAIAAQQVLLDVRQALENEEIATCIAARVLYLTRITLLSPSATNRDSCADFIAKNEHGTANWWKIIGGSFIAFLGAASIAISAGIALTVSGIGLLAGGVYLAYQGRTTGLARSLNGFFNQTEKTLAESASDSLQQNSSLAPA